MKKIKQGISKTNIILLSCLAFFILLLVLCLCLSLSKDASEWWTNNIARWYFYIVGHINSIFPFSMTEILIGYWVVVLITLIILIIIYLTKKVYKNLISLGLSICLLGIGIYSSYYATCGLAYHRYEMPINLYEENVESNQFKTIITYFIDDFNYTASTLNANEDGMLYCPYDLNELSNILIKEYEKIDDNYFYDYTPKGKPLALSWFFTQNHIAGMSFSITGEPNINMMNLPSDYGFSLAHEMAHQKGVMREQDANLLAAYVCLNSSNPYLRYSGYNRTIFSLISLANYVGESNLYSQLINTLNQKIKNDINYGNKFWSKNDLFSKLGTFFNDLYLTLFGNGGVSSYDDTWDVEDSGQKDEDGNPIYNITFSNYQKLFFGIYYDIY